MDSASTALKRYTATVGLEKKVIFSFLGTKI